MTYGSELHDDPATGVCTDHGYRWRYSWPGQLGRLIDADGVYNDGIPSGSNDRILRSTIDFVAHWSQLRMPPEALLVVIGWSHPARREFFVAGGYRQVVPHHYYDIRALDRLVAKYRTAAVSDEEAAMRYAVQVAALRGFLIQQRIPCLFFNSITSVPLPEHLRDSCVQEAFTDGRFLNHDIVEPTMVQFLRNRPNTWNAQHPNETGHKMWADRVAREIDPSEFPAVDRARLTEAGLFALGGTRVAHRHDRKGVERMGRFIRSHRIRFPIRHSDQSDQFIYP